MQKIIKVGALLVVSAGVIYTSVLLYTQYVANTAIKDNANREVDLFPIDAMGNIECLQPPCIR